MCHVFVGIVIDAVDVNGSHGFWNLMTVNIYNSLLHHCKLRTHTVFYRLPKRFLFR